MMTQPEETTERLLTMQEAMDYLSNRGVPCKSRVTFYRLIEDFDIPYLNAKPHGRYEVRRFRQEALDKFLVAYTK